MAGPARISTPLSLKSRALPWLVLGAGLGLSVAVWLFARAEVKRQDAVRFERLTERMLDGIEARFQAAKQALYGGRALVESTGEISQPQWAGYVSSVWPFFDRGVVGLGYVQRLPRSQLDAMEQRLKAAYPGLMEVERDGTGDHVYLVTHVEPLTRNFAALGKDIASGTTRRAAADKAMRTNAAIVTRRIHVIEGTARFPGCLLFLPVYASNAAPTNAAERERALQGWVYASLRVDLMLQGVAAAAGGQLDIEAFDGEDAQPETLLFNSAGKIEFDAAKWAAAGRRNGFSITVLQPVFGRTWLLRLRTNAAFAQRNVRRLTWMVLASGVLLSFFGAGFTWALTHKRRAAEKIAEGMTANLRRAEAEARRLALVASRTASVVVITDADWRIQWVNESFERFFGFQFEEIKGRRPGEILQGPDTSEETLAQLDAAMERGEPFKGEILNYTKDKQPRWVDVDIQPLKDDAGRVTGFMALQLDITERKRIQAEIAQKEAEFRFIFESAPIGLSWLWVGPDGARRRLTNQAHLKLIGLTTAQMQEPGVFRRITHPEDWVAQQELYQKLERGEIDHFSITKRYQRLDGRKVYVELTFHRFRDPRGGYQEVSTLVDVTPLVLLSSLGAREEVTNPELFAAFLTKPAKPAHLVETLASLLKSEPGLERPVSAHPFVSAPTTEPTESERVLLAEDNAVNQKVALLMLRQLGFRADVAADGHEALQAVQRQHYDIVLMDVQMPEMDGLEASRKICERWPDRRKRPWIIAITANAMQGDREACFAAGMDDYISKPIKIEELAAALERARNAIRPG